MHLRNALVDVEQEFIDAAADARGKAFRIVVPVPLFIDSASDFLHSFFIFITYIISKFI